MSGIPSAGAIQRLAEANAIYDAAYERACKALGFTKAATFMDLNLHFQADSKAREELRKHHAEEDLGA